MSDEKSYTIETPKGAQSNPPAPGDEVVQGEKIETTGTKSGAFRTGPESAD